MSSSNVRMPVRSELTLSIQNVIFMLNRRQKGPAKEYLEAICKLLEDRKISIPDILVKLVWYTQYFPTPSPRWTVAWDIEHVLFKTLGIPSPTVYMGKPGGPCRITDCIVYDDISFNRALQEVDRRIQYLQDHHKSPPPFVPISDISCVGCHENQPDTVIIPCYHVALCTPCGSALRQCPICREPRGS